MYVICSVFYTKVWKATRFIVDYQPTVKLTNNLKHLKCSETSGKKIYAIICSGQKVQKSVISHKNSGEWFVL